MAQPTLDQLMWAIGQQESGGNYSVVNSIGAVGKYQVMKANIPSWSKAALGYSISWQTFRNSPSLQEKIVRYKLNSYYKNYGFRGAASAWYSGNPRLDMNTNAQNGGPSIKAYVDSVWNRAQGAPANTKTGSTTTTSSGGGGGGTKAPDPLSKSELAETYGFVDTLFESVPELKKLFQKAVNGQWTASKFQASLRDTKWWKTKSDTARQFLILQYGDPASAKQKLAQAKVMVTQLSNQLGVRGGKDMPGQLNKWALNVVMDGWDESRLRYDMGKWISFGGDVRSGEGGEALDKLKDFAYNMGVDMDSKWYANAGRAIVRGTGSQQDYEDKIRTQAKTLYTVWKKQIDQGMTVADLAAPYFSSMSQILELPQGSISLFTPAIKKALQNKDKITGANTIKPMWQFENDLRADPRWKKTSNAQNSMMQIAHQVLSDFGVKT